MRMTVTVCMSSTSLSQFNWPENKLSFDIQTSLISNYSIKFALLYQSLKSDQTDLRAILCGLVTSAMLNFLPVGYQLYTGLFSEIQSLAFARDMLGGFFTLSCPNGIVFPWEIRVAFSQGKSQLQQSRATQPKLIIKCMLGLFSCFRNPPNSHVDYMVFNVRTWSFLCVRIHMGVGHTDSESA